MTKPGAPRPLLHTAVHIWQQPVSQRRWSWKDAKSLPMIFFYRHGPVAHTHRGPVAAASQVTVRGTAGERSPAGAPRGHRGVTWHVFNPLPADRHTPLAREHREKREETSTNGSIHDEDQEETVRCSICFYTGALGCHLLFLFVGARKHPLHGRGIRKQATWYEILMPLTF